MRRALVITGSFVAIFLLGFMGLRSDGGFTVENAYRILQLFTLEGDWTHELETIPWQIQLVRFLAPVTLVGTAILVLAQDALLKLGNLSARFFSKHIVVIGLNEHSWHLIRTAVRRGRRVVVLERDGENPRVEECRKLGVRVIVDDWLAARNLQRCSVLRAASVVAFTENDGTNVELMLLTKRLLAAAGAVRDPLRFHIHLMDTRLAVRLQEYPKFFDNYELAEVNFFNSDEKSARTLFRDYPFELYADALRKDRVHIAIFGFNAPAEQLILKIARTAHYARNVRPKVTVFCSKPEAARFGFLAEHRYALEVMDLSYEPEQPDGRPFFEGDDTEVLQSVTAYIVCQPDDQASLNQALALRAAVLLGKGENAPIFVRMRSSDGVAQLLEGGDEDSEVPDGIFPFGMLDRVLDVASVVDEHQDILARAFHEAHRSYAETVVGRGKRASDKPWNLLPEYYRDRNRTQTDHIDIKLRAIGYRRAPTGATLAFGDDEVEIIARMENERYMAEQRLLGYRFGGKKDEQAKVLVESEAKDLSQDRSTQRQIPTILAEHLGESITRDVIVGITGHRHEVDFADPGLQAACKATLRTIRDANPGASFVVMSSLAEGADRFVADLALDILDATLRSPLPLPYEHYVQDFDENNGSVDEFKQFVARAEEYFELPLCFAGASELTDQNARANQYALAGAYIVQRCHELIALWDGKPPDGRGGTGDVVDWRVNGVPAEYHYPCTYFPPVEARMPYVIPPVPGLDFVPQRLEAWPPLNDAL